MTAPVTVYARPGCPFSAALRWQLRRLAVPFEEIDIWEDRDAAARVREITGGDETVPTVVVGGRPMVNPGVERVRAALAEFAPGLETTVPRSPVVLAVRGLVGPALVLAVWAAVVVITPDTPFPLGPALLAASWAVAARADAARALGFGLGGVLAAGAAAFATAVLLALPALGVAGPSVPGAVFAVAGGAALGVIVAGRRPHPVRSGRS